MIRISFTSIGFQSLGLTAALDQELNNQAKAFGLSLESEGNVGKFKELITKLAKENKVVILIDEYDAPIINYLGKEIDKAYQNRELLKEFYSVLKDLDAAIEFVFLTGVSKFSKVGIFSGLNNLTDLTMLADYATMLGYTQAELESNFAEELEETSRFLTVSKQALLDKSKGKKYFCLFMTLIKIIKGFFYSKKNS